MLLDEMLLEGKPIAECLAGRQTGSPTGRLDFAWLSIVAAAAGRYLPLYPHLPRSLSLHQPSPLFEQGDDVAANEVAGAVGRGNSGSGMEYSRVYGGVWW